jgi:hypothetical protein
MLNFKFLLTAVFFLVTNTSVLTFPTPVFAQTHYDKIEAGNTISGGIKLGTFSSTMPLPPGQWQVLAVTPDKIRLDNGNYAARVNYFLKDPTGLSPIHSLLVTITPDSANNVNWTNSQCQSKDTKAIAVDDFGTNPNSLSYACAVARKQIPLKALVAGAATSKNSFVKNFLGLMAQDEQIPEEVVELWIVSNKYGGRQMRLTMFLRADGAEAVTAAAIKAYVGETGQAMLNFLGGKEASLGLPALQR